MTSRQLIDAKGQFIGQLPSAKSPETLNYTTIAVVGCQSGGKSTLLNRAFDTAFPVLNASKTGRRQTTLGVWVAIRDQPTPQIILDVEGTDSRERGEGATAFESRTTLFALALADVVFVNMWAHDVGRYSAANYDLFETVFAHAIALRKRDPALQRRVRVLIVVRDHDSDTALSDIRRVLMGDIQNIWDSLGVNSFAFGDVFNMDVVALPHMLYSPEQFDSQVRILADNIGAGGTPHTNLVPLAGFDAFARTVWSSICRVTGGDGPNAEFSLDLPKHAALAAHYQIGEIVTTMFEGDIGTRLEDFRVEIEMEWRQPVKDFGVRVESIVRDAFAGFDEATVVYKTDAAQEAVVGRRLEVGGMLMSKVSDLRERYLSVCRDFCMNGFEDEFRPMLGGTNGYERNARRLANSFIARYRTLVEGASLPSSLKEFVVDELVTHDEVEGVPQTERNYDSLDAEYGLLDEDDGEEYSCDRFKKDVFRMVDERKRFGELMLPGGGAPLALGPKPDPWWKGLLIRAFILAINYLQATQGQRAALKLQRQHDKEFPPGPTF